MPGDSASMDVQYLKTSIAAPLTQALAEAARTNPQDPVTFVGEYLIHYRKHETTRQKDQEKRYTYGWPFDVKPPPPKPVEPEVLPSVPVVKASVEQTPSEPIAEQSTPAVATLSSESVPNTEELSAPLTDENVEPLASE